MIVRLGPFSELHYSLLTKKLEEAGAAFTRIEEPELVQAYIAARKHVEVHLHPSYSGSLPEYIFLDVQKEYLLLIKRDLDALGFSLLPASQTLFEEEELRPVLVKSNRRIFYVLTFLILLIFILMRSSI